MSLTLKKHKDSLVETIVKDIRIRMHRDVYGYLLNQTITDNRQRCEEEIGIECCSFLVQRKNGYSGSLRQRRPTQ